MWNQSLVINFSFACYAHTMADRRNFWRRSASAAAVAASNGRIQVKRHTFWDDRPIKIVPADCILFDAYVAFCIGACQTVDQSNTQRDGRMYLVSINSQKWLVRQPLLDATTDQISKIIKFHCPSATTTVTANENGIVDVSWVRSIRMIGDVPLRDCSGLTGL